MASRNSPYPGKLYDGRTAGKISVIVRPTEKGIDISFADQRKLFWLYTSVRLAARGGSKEPLRIEHIIREGNISRVETLVIPDTRFLETVENIAPKCLGSLWDQPRHTRLKRLLLCLAVIVIPFLLYGVWKVAIPVVADAFVPSIPVEWEEKLGNRAYEAMFGDPPLSADPKIKKALDNIAQRLLAPVKEQPYNFRIYIHSEKIFNAMALPGGIIVVYQGLIDNTESPEELAGVLAHEFQHVLQRHPTRNLVRQVTLSVILGMMVGDTSSVMGLILETAGTLGSLNYSREMEVEADEKGMNMMLDAGVDPKGMISIFEKLTQQFDFKKVKNDTSSEKNGDLHKFEKKNEVEESSSWMEYLSTHPAGKDRIKMLNKIANEYQGKLVQPLLPDFKWKMMRHPEKKVDDNQGGVTK
ncbi:MAG: M48 family metallopeptidase [Nitrospinales bacterium]